MARQSDVGSTLGGLSGLSGIAVVISVNFKINFFIALAIVFGGLFSLNLIVIGIASIATSVKQNKRCAYGVRRGKEGGCHDCLAEEERRLTEWKASQVVYDRLKAIKKDAMALRNSELRALTTKWLSRSELYHQMTPQRFEASVAVLFRQLGYEVKQTPYSNDRGKDAIAWRGGKKYLIECKHYAAVNVIGRRDLQIFVAAMKEENAEAGFYINTGRFAKTAIEYAAQNQIDLYDGKRFPALVNAAFPIKEEISTTKVMCLECGTLLTLPIRDAPTSGVCENEHTVTNDITVPLLLCAPFVPSTPMSGPPALPDVSCDRCKSKGRRKNNFTDLVRSCSSTWAARRAASGEALAAVRALVRCRSDSSDGRGGL